MHHIHHLAEDVKLLIVSDGSSYESQSMSFGVTVLATSSGYHILSNKGPGHTANHRLTEPAVLAVSRALLMKHWQKFTQIPFPQGLSAIVISDNAAMISSLLDRATYQDSYPNATLVPNWDLLEEIHQQYNSTPNPTCTFQWVRGHQDNSNSSSVPGKTQYPSRYTRHGIPHHGGREKTTADTIDECHKRHPPS